MKLTINHGKRAKDRDAPRTRGLRLRFSSNPFNARNAWKNIRQNPRENTTQSAEKEANKAQMETKK